MTASIERAIELAAHYHAGQKDKAGKAYIFHTLAVMNRVEHEDEKITAVLHDIVEDTPMTLEQLRQEGFSETIITAIDALTKRSGESKEQAVERAKQHPVARAVKLADLQENADLTRIANPSDADRERTKRYQALIAAF